MAIAGDGQVTMGQSIVMKNTARKVRRLYIEDMEKEIDELETLLQGRKSRRSFAVIPTDW